MELNLQKSFSGSRILGERDISGFYLVDGIYDAKTKVPAHSHEQAVFCIALQGVCRESFAGRVRDYEPLTVQFLPSHQCHSLDFSFGATHAFSIDVSRCWLDRGREYSLKLEDSIHSHGGSLAKLMLKVYGEFRRVDDASRLAIEGLMLELLAEVSRHQIEPTEKYPPKWLDRAVDLLKEQFPERLRISEVAADVGVHPVHLAREFRRFKRRTIGDYIRELRVQHACNELQNPETSLAGIAATAGFSDQSHFCRTFKRVIGMTPTEYRSTLSSH